MEPQDLALREETLQREETSILEQIRLVREHDEQMELAIVNPEIVQLAELGRTMPASHPISVGDKIALWSSRLEQQEVERDASELARERDISLVSSADVADANVGADLHVAMEVLIEMEHTLVAERQSKAEMVDNFERLVQELEARLAKEKQRNAESAEMKREMEVSHARDVAVLEGMVERVLEENDRLVCDVEAWKAAASGKCASDGNGSSNASTTSGDDESGGTCRTKGNDSANTCRERVVSTLAVVEAVPLVSEWRRCSEMLAVCGSGTPALSALPSQRNQFSCAGAAFSIP